MTRLSNLQRQLSSNYKKDEFLRDQILIAADIPKIQQSMRERVPESAADAQNRIATFLSSEPKSAGAHVVFEDDSAMYTTGYKFGGQARKSIRDRKGNSNQNRSLSKWLAGHKGCFVCKKPQIARHHHSREEVSKAINELKQKYPAAMVTVDDLAMIVSDMTDGYATQSSEESNSAAEHDDSSATDEDLVNFAAVQEDTDRFAEAYLSNASFVHGRSYHTDMAAALAAMHEDLLQGGEARFKGIYIDTCANRPSVMSFSQYQSYCKEFHVPVGVDTSSKRMLSGLGGRSAPIWSAVIPVPFEKLKLVIDVRFQFVRDNVASLLSMKDMVDNGLDISLTNREIRFSNLSQP